jgi:ADP-heptose:LPS heptosyltransferase
VNGGNERSRGGLQPRLLLVRSEHLGDILFTLPAVVALRRALPGARVTYLVPSGLEDLPARCPAVDEVIHLPFPAVEGPADPAGWMAVVAREGPRLQGRFDAALLFRPADPWAGALTREASIPVRLGYLEPATRPYLTGGIPHRPEAHAVSGALELVELAVRRLGGAGVTPPVAGRERVLVLTATDRAEARRTLAPLHHLVGARPIVLHPGVGWPLKLWPAEHWGQVAQGIHRRFGRRPVVTGVTTEQDRVDRVVKASRGSAVGLTGRLSLGGFAALLEDATVAVAADSGPLHLAAVLGTPIVGLYGPAGPAEAGPWCPPAQRRVVRVDLPCSPCGTMVAPPCGAARNPACMTGITAEEILLAVETLAPMPS